MIRLVVEGLHSNRVGDRALGAVMSALLADGYVVLMPIGEHRYDLVIEREGRFHRVQVSRLRKDCVVFNCYSTNGSTSVRRRYTADEIDFFGVYCRDLRQCYLVPLLDVGQEGRLRTTVARNGQQGLRMATTYEIPKPM